MPNHVANELNIAGDRSTLEDFERFARGEPIQWAGSDKPNRVSELELSNFIHPELKNRGRELSIPFSDLANGGDMGYDWCTKNWGTKWGAYDTHFFNQEQLGEGEISYQFNTAWSPFNLEVCLSMSKLFPSLRFELNYFEEGMGFEGKRIWSGNLGIQLDHCHDMKDDSDGGFKHNCEVTSG